jgi:hypothetical protein
MRTGQSFRALELDSSALLILRPSYVDREVAPAKYDVPFFGSQEGATSSDGGPDRPGDADPPVVAGA